MLCYILRLLAFCSCSDIKKKIISWRRQRRILTIALSENAFAFRLIIPLFMSMLCVGFTSKVAWRQRGLFAFEVFWQPRHLAFPLSNEPIFEFHGQSYKVHTLMCLPLVYSQPPLFDLCWWDPGCFKSEQVGQPNRSSSSKALMKLVAGGHLWGLQRQWVIK